jgi:hypothetical protein
MRTNVADTKRAHCELIVNEHIEAESIRHDVTATVETFRHPRYEVPALGIVADGAEAVNGLLGAFLTAFPDFDIARTAVRHADNAVNRRVTFAAYATGRVGRDRAQRKEDVRL